MPTTPEKPAKPRPRSRKASQQKTVKAGSKAQVLSDHAKLAADSISPMTAAIEDKPIEAAQAEVALDVAQVDVAPEAAPIIVAMETARQEMVEEQTAHEQIVNQVAQEQVVEEAALNGEVLPPEVRVPTPPTGFFGIAQAYGEYTRKSWHNGRFLVERLIAARSFDEAIEVQGEFAKQAYANFIVQSQKIGVLYGECAQQFFRPFEKFATGWPRIGR